MATLNREEWLDQREIGASDAPVIMEVSPYKTKRKLWEEKVCGKKVYDNKYMQRGRELEPIAIKWFEKKTGIKMEQSTYASHKERAWMTATFDGINTQKKVILEVKCPSAKNFAWQSKKVPEMYYPQIQHALEVAGYDKAYYLCFDGESGVIHEIGGDAKYQKDLLKEEKAFYQSLIDIIPPEERYQLVENDDEFNELASKIVELNRLTGELDQLKKEAIQRAGGKEIIVNGIKISRSKGRKTISYKDIPELKKIDLEPYTKQGKEIWRINLMD